MCRLEEEVNPDSRETLDKFQLILDEERKNRGLNGSEECQAFVWSLPWNDKLGPRFWFYVKYPGTKCKIATFQIFLCSMSLRDLKPENLSADQGADAAPPSSRSSSASVNELECAGERQAEDLTSSHHHTIASPKTQRRRPSKNQTKPYRPSRVRTRMQTKRPVVVAALNKADPLCPYIRRHPKKGMHPFSPSPSIG